MLNNIYFISNAPAGDINCMIYQMFRYELEGCVGRKWPLYSESDRCFKRYLRSSGQKQIGVHIHRSPCIGH